MSKITSVADSYAAVSAQNIISKRHLRVDPRSVHFLAQQPTPSKSPAIYVGSTGIAANYFDL